MKLEKAIRDLQARVDGEFYIEGEDDCEDMKLGIEALRDVKKARCGGPALDGELLPGETES